MLHELLLALFGFEGDVFLTDKDSGHMKVVESFPYLHPSEVSLLNRICRLGGYYKSFEAFIAEQSRPSVTLLQAERREGEGGSRGGLYLRALADGLNTVLQDYRQVLLAVEKKALADPHLPITQVEHELEEYQLLFPAINDLLETVSENKSHGCQVLSLIHQRKVCGIPCVEKTMDRLLFTCHGVLYRQLAAWMLHGLLLDDHCEFFVEQERPTVEEPPQPDKTEEQRPQGEGEGPGARKVKFTADSKHERKAASKKEAVKTIAVKHTLNHMMLPSYVPVRLAEKVFFVGEALQLFKRNPQKHILEEQPSANLLTKEDEARFAAVLSELQKQCVFSIWDFETAVNTIRDHVSQNLWRLIVQDSDLVGHLQTVKDFFLLGRGELFLCFNDHAQALLRKPVTETSEHDVNLAFQQSLNKVGIDNESITNHFKLTLPPRQEKGDARAPGSGGGGWSCLGLAYSPPWPLHILFTPQILQRYNELFRFLLSVRRVQTMLQEAWGLQMVHKERAAELGLLWQLRTQMAFLVDNLQYYVQVDVLESQFSLLLDNITSTLDFESIKLSHEHFVATLQGQLFLSMPSVFSCLCDILDACTTFCGILHSTDLTFTQRDREQINLLAKDFDRHSSLLFRLLSDVKSHHHSPHLSQMMLRIDYNKFFSSTSVAVIPFPEGAQTPQAALHSH